MTPFKLEESKRTLSEYSFRQRVLQTAQEVLLYSLGAHKRNKQRPLLNNQDLLETATKERKTYGSTLSCVWEEAEETNDEIDESLFETHHPMHSCEEPADHHSRVDETIEIDDWSFAMDTTTSYALSESLSLSDYIVLSDTNDGISGPSGVRMEYDGEEECSYSILSGCDTVYSLNENNDDFSSKEDMEQKPVLFLSYCMAAKLGNARSKHHGQELPAEEQTAIEKVPNDAPSCNATVTNHWKKQKPNTEVVVNNYDCDEEEEEEDLFLSLYDAAKSGHGGNPATRFKGNSRTIHSFNGWGRHRRPNWSRKRRKECKKSRTWWW